MNAEHFTCFVFRQSLCKKMNLHDEPNIPENLNLCMSARATKVTSSFALGNAWYINWRCQKGTEYMLASKNFVSQHTIMHHLKNQLHNDCIRTKCQKPFRAHQSTHVETTTGKVSIVGRSKKKLYDLFSYKSMSACQLFVTMKCVLVCACMCVSGCVCVEEVDRSTARWTNKTGNLWS